MAGVSNFGIARWAGNVFTNTAQRKRSGLGLIGDALAANQAGNVWQYNTLRVAAKLTASNSAARALTCGWAGNVTCGDAQHGNVDAITGANRHPLQG